MSNNNKINHGMIRCIIIIKVKNVHNIRHSRIVDERLIQNENKLEWAWSSQLCYTSAYEVLV